MINPKIFVIGRHYRKRCRSRWDLLRKQLTDKVKKIGKTKGGGQFTQRTSRPITCLEPLNAINLENSSNGIESDIRDFLSLRGPTEMNSDPAVIRRHRHID